MARTKREWPASERSTRNCLQAKVYGDRVTCARGYKISSGYSEFQDGGLSLRRVEANSRLLGSCKDCTEGEWDAISQ